MTISNTPHKIQYFNYKEKQINMFAVVRQVEHDGTNPDKLNFVLKKQNSYGT